MSGDDEIIKPESLDNETDEAALADELETSPDKEALFQADDQDEAVVKPKRALPSWMLAIVGGAALSLGAGVLGGFIAYKVFDRPPPPPDLSGVEAQIKDIETQAAKQTRGSAALQKQVKTLTSRLDEDVNSLETKLLGELTVIEDRLANYNQALPVEIETGTDIAVKAETEIGQGEANAPAADKALQSDINALRGNLQRELKSVKARLAKLETRARETADIPNETKPLGISAFPSAQILAQVNQAEEPAAPKNWLQRLTDKHVSVKRTSDEGLADLLGQIEALVAAQDWNGAAALSDDLPAPARKAALDWLENAQR